MAKQTLTSPSAVLKKLMDDYGLNPSKLGAAISLNQATLRLILLGKGKITYLIALRFSKFFGKTPEYWLNLQNKYDLVEAAKDKELTAVLKNIKKAEKVPAAKKEPKGAAKKDDPKAKRTSRTAAAKKSVAEPKRTSRTAAAKKSAADSKRTSRAGAAAVKAPAVKRTAAKKLAAESKPAPTGAKRGRKPKSAAAIPAASEPDPVVESNSFFESESVFESGPVFIQESVSDPLEGGTDIPPDDAFSLFPPAGMDDSEELE
ncbi:MAG: HigA family addiction module antidote protein [Spirochaetaceae bacterium]|jgi:addiction module HigA family antidote|nr:HigA family addiction module antidote protein [Spirochaetaceae bacterium]